METVNDNLLRAPVKRKVLNGFRAPRGIITEMNILFNERMDKAYEDYLSVSETNQPKTKL